MAKIAILSYDMIFDPSESWSSGYQFENQLSDFFAAHGFEAEIIETSGGSGRRVIYLSRAVQIVPIENKPNPQVTNQIKKVQQQIPPKGFKKFQEPKHSDTTPPKTTYFQGKTLRRKVRFP